MEDDVVQTNKEWCLECQGWVELPHRCSGSFLKITDMSKDDRRKECRILFGDPLVLAPQETIKAPKK